MSAGTHPWINERVAVLAGGTSCEREVSLVSGRNVFEALHAKGLSVLWVDAVGDFMSRLKEENITIAFVALHGAFGEDGAVQRLLEKEGISYTGSDVRSSSLAFDKSKSQALFRRENILVPEFIVFENISQIQQKIPFDFPIVVKPAKAGSSVGVTVLTDCAGYEAACLDAFRYSDTILIERFIAGRELTVGILGEQPLPIVEVTVQRKFYDYEAKYGDSGTRYEVPAKLTPSQTEKITHEAMRAHEALGCRTMSRVDLILAPDDKAYVLEVNTIPGLTSKSLLPKAAASAGIDFSALCVRILTLALTERKVVQTRG
jgi:D-alanine--D-alanine ligase